MKKLRFSILFLVILFLASLSVLGVDSNTTSTSEWLQLGRNFDNNRFYTSSINVTNYGHYWNLTIHDQNPYIGSPVAKDNVIYVPSIYGGFPVTSNILALNADTGAVLWNTSIPSYNAEIQHSAIAGEYLYVTGSSNSADVFALNRTNGAIIWNQTARMTGGNYPTAPLVYDNKVFVIGTHSAVNAQPMLFVYNYSTGEQIQNRTIFPDLNYKGSQTMAIWNDTYLLVGAGHGTCGVLFSGVGKVYALNVSDISQQFWTQDVGCGQMQGITSKEEYVFVPLAGNETLWTLNVTNGNHIWNITLNQSIYSSAVALTTPTNDILVYIGNHDTNLFAINASTGIIAWNRSNTMNSYTTPVISNNVLFVSYGPTIYALNPLNGSLLWNDTIEATSASPPLVVDNSLFIVDSLVGALGGKIYSFGQLPGCGVINSSIILRNDLNSTGTCIRANASDIVIDCAGFSITGNRGPLSKGIELLKNNITVKNCVVKEFLWGIYLDGSNNSIIQDNNVSEINYSGLTMQYSDRATITGNNFDNSDVGMYIFDSESGNFMGNQMDNNSVGIQFLPGASFNNFTDEAITNSRSKGIEILNNLALSNRFMSINISNTTTFDLVLSTPDPSNTFYDITLIDSMTTITFAEYNGTTEIKGIANPPAAPTGLQSIGKSLNITKTNGDWIVLNISYSDTDIANVQENTLTLYRHNGTDWYQTNGTSTVVAASNIITANLTEFSTFSPFGQATQQITGSGGGGGSSYSRIDVSDLDVLEQITKNLRKLNSFEFIRNAEKHKLTLKTLDYMTKTVQVRIESTPKYYDLQLNQPIEIDTNEDGYTDVKMELKEIDHTSATLNLKRIVETLPPRDLVSKPEETQTEKTEIQQKTPQTNYDYRDSERPNEDLYEFISKEKKENTSMWFIVIILILVIAGWLIIKNKETIKKALKKKN